MCNNPCNVCGDYDECTIYYRDSRCRSCKHDKEDILKSPCKDCSAFGVVNNDKEDKYEKIIL